MDSKLNMKLKVKDVSGLIKRLSKLNLIPKAKSKNKRKNKTPTLRINTHKDIQILNLPKMPFGKHSDYNNDSPSFVDTHFRSLQSSSESPDLQMALKNYNFSKQTKKKAFFTSRESFLDKNKHFIIYKTSAGDLVTTKYKTKITEYEKSKKFSPPLSSSSKTLSSNSSPLPLIRPQKQKNSLKALISRLYPNPQSPSSPLATSITSRFSHLFT